MRETSVQAVRRDCKLATSVDTELTEHAKDTPHYTALQESSVVAEREVASAADHDAHPLIRWQTIVDRLNISKDPRGTLFA
jgi:hypothetical protein